MGRARQIAGDHTMTSTTTLLPVQADSMTLAQLAAVSYLARYSGHTDNLYTYPLRRWFTWCDINHLDALAGIQRPHVVVAPTCTCSSEPVTASSPSTSANRKWLPISSTRWRYPA